MKKLFALALCVIMLCAAVLPMTVSAAGIILMEDNFDVMDETKWDYVDSHFEVIDGRIEGYSDAVVHQSNGFESLDGHMAWGTGTCFSVDCWIMDNDRGDEDPWIGIWWSDYFASEEDDELEGTITYYMQYHPVDSTVRVVVNYDGADAEQYKPADIEEGETAYTWFTMEVPQKMDLANAVKFNLGFRVNNGVITFYLDNKLVYTHACERGAVCGTTAPSPFLLWNVGGYSAFDNALVATADYDMFNEGAVTEPAVTDPAQTEPIGTKAPETTKIEEVVVTEIGEDGEVVTKIETVIVTNAPTPDTQKNPTNPQGGAQTGDMAVIVIAVMAVALGAAVVVKKVND